MANLYIVPTPIGNLEDMSLRALNILSGVNVILCEDTRTSQKLLNHFHDFSYSFNHSTETVKINLKNKKLISYHEHNEEKRVEEILKILDNGEDLALVSDAGTPLISDPGSVIIKALSETDHKVVPLPGASALTTALSACPFEIEQFSFHGFLPSSGQHRRRVLKKLFEKLTAKAVIEDNIPDYKKEKKVAKADPISETLVFYESPHRLLKTLDDIESIFSELNLEVFLARELTKKFEELYTGSFEAVKSQLRDQFKNEAKILGEFVVILNIGSEPF